MPPTTQTEPPYVPVRQNGWSVRRTPRSFLLVGLAVLLAAVAVGLVHKPSKAERAADLRGVLHSVTTDIQSCAGGVDESLQALRQVQAEGARSSSDVADAISIAQQGAANCSPANNELIDDLENYQVPESLASFRLPAVVTGLVNWAAPLAEQVQTDVANLLSAKTPQAKAAAQSALARAITALDAQRARIDSALNTAIKALDMRASPPRLPG